MKKIFNILFYTVIALLLITKVPGIYENFKKQNHPAPLANLKRLSGEEISFPVPNQKMIVVFWATWCGPCKVELNRLNKMMAQGKIKSNQLLAISIQESKETVQDFLLKNPFQFLIALDESGQVAQMYNVRGTPTIVFLDEASNVNWITTGLSPALELRVQNFLKN
jgi:cytochrome c biogenesis protein CcmG/thiol:disulfide interchange protein DsbE